MQDVPHIAGINAAQRLAQATQAFIQSLSEPHASAPSPQQHAKAASADSASVASQAVLQRMNLSDGATPSSEKPGAASGSASVSREQHTVAPLGITGGQSPDSKAGDLSTGAATGRARQAGSESSAESGPEATRSQPSLTAAMHSTSGGIAGAQLQQQLQPQQQKVGRIVVQSLGGVQWHMGSFDKEVEQQLFKAVLHIKTLVRDSRCAAMLSFPSGGSSHQLHCQAQAAVCMPELSIYACCPFSLCAL